MLPVKKATREIDPRLSFPTFTKMWSKAPGKSLMGTLLSMKSPRLLPRTCAWYVSGGIQKYLSLHK